MMNRVRLIYQLLILVFALAISANHTAAQNNPDKKIRVTATSQSKSVQTDPPPRWGTTAYIEKEVFKLINSEREKQGLKPLVWNDRIANIARQHCRNMAEQHLFSHQEKDGSIVSNRADKANIKWISIAENIVRFIEAPDPASYATERWMASPPHKVNILTKGWKQTGIGAIVAPDGFYYVTQVFLY